MKKMLIAGALLVYAFMFVNTDPDAVTTVSTNPITITENVSIDSSAADMTAYGLSDPSAHAFREISMSQALQIFQQGGSAILFFAKPDGTECVTAAPVLNEAAMNLSVTVYYVDTNSDYTQDDYNALTSLISETFVTDDSGSKSFFVPDVVAVKDGALSGYHVSLLDGISAAASSVQLSSDQKNELYNDYVSVIQSAADNAVSSSSAQ